MTTPKTIGLEEEQARVPQEGEGAAWIFENLRNSIMFWIRRGGMVKELIVRPKQDGEEFPLEWFYEFRVTLWLRDDTEIVCDVIEVRHIKRKWFFLVLSPNPVHEEDLWTALQEEDVSRIELQAGEEHLVFAWKKDLRLFKREVN